MQTLRTDDYGSIKAPEDTGPLSGLKGLLGRFTRNSVMAPSFKSEVTAEGNTPIDYDNIGSVIGGRIREGLMDPLKNAGEAIQKGMTGQQLSIKDLLSITELNMDLAMGGGFTAAMGRKGLNPNVVSSFPAVTMNKVDAFTKPTVPQIKATLFKKVTPEEFIPNRERTKRTEFLTPYNKDEMSAWDNYLTDDGVGFSLTDKQDIVGIFNNSGKRGAGQEAVVTAINKGGKTLDNIVGFLDDYYSKFGFKIKEKLKWDDQYAPKGWNYEKYGRPEITLWEYPKGLSREPSDVRNRFKAATGQ
jgi:hypothetical protein